MSDLGGRTEEVVELKMDEIIVQKMKNLMNMLLTDKGGILKSFEEEDMLQKNVRILKVDEDGG
jgi:hypothetical protein